MIRICDTWVEANSFKVYWTSQGLKVTVEELPNGYYKVTTFKLTDACRIYGTEKG